MTLSRRDLLGLGAGALAAALLPSCKSAGGGQATVEMVGMTFEPARLTVKAGVTVRWINRSDLQHTVTAYEGDIPADAAYLASGGAASEDAARENISGGFIGPGASYEVSLDVPGTYVYFCIPHEDQGMTGSVVVEG